MTGRLDFIRFSLFPSGVDIFDYGFHEKCFNLCSESGPFGVGHLLFTNNIHKFIQNLTHFLIFIINMIIAPFFLLATIFLRPFLHYPEMDKWGRGPWAACPVCSLAVVTVTGGRGLKRDLFFEFLFFSIPGS